MKLIKYVFIVSVFLITIDNIHSQTRINIKSLIEQLGQNARVYFLSANRPSFGVSAYTTPKDELELSLGLSLGEDFIETPVDISYGLAKNVELFGGITAYTQSYNFEGTKTSGVGDGNIGIRYKFHESKNFSHAIQTAVKLPIANATKELGTGKVDFNFGLGHEYSANKWGYDAGIEFNLLHRKDLPGTRNRVPVVLQNVIDSIKKVYNYTYEPEIAFSVSPAYYPADNVYVYSGFSFSRNMKLDYNSSSIYGGIGYSPSRLIGFSLGTSYGLNDGGSWLVSLGVNISLIRKMY